MTQGGLVKVGATHIRKEIARAFAANGATVFVVCGIDDRDVQGVAGSCQRRRTAEM
jgi:hypothetical protein